MRAVIQRVTQGSVSVAGETVGAIQHGLVVLVGVTHTDKPADALALAKKVAYLRIFEDDAGKINRSALDVKGELLIVPSLPYMPTAGTGGGPVSQTPLCLSWLFLCWISSSTHCRRRGSAG